MRSEQCGALLPGDGGNEGLSWSWHLDIETVLAALAEPAPWNRSPRPSAGPTTPATNPSTESTEPSSAAANPPGPDPSGPDPSGPEPPSADPPTAEPPAVAEQSGLDQPAPEPTTPKPPVAADQPDPDQPDPTPATAADQPDPTPKPPAADQPDPTPTTPQPPATADQPDPTPTTAKPPGPDPAGSELPGGRSAGVRTADAGSPIEGGPGAGIDPVEADFAEYLDAVDSGRSSVVSLPAVAGRVAEVLPPSPDLAAWLACSPAEELEDGALAGAAAAYRRLAAWAQAGELAVVAQLAARSAAADKTNGTGADGRPGTIPADAYGQVSLALTLSQAGAEWWTNLAVDLQWRLAATGAALREGVIDLARAKAIVEATASLDEDKARTVEARVLPRAGQQTTSQLRASLRRAVITADPEGAERRREEAERRAKVTLYPDAEGTASLTGQNLPGVRAAAAFARITALARALKASGADGGIDMLRSNVLLGLLLGTLPYIPPPPGGPSDADCPPDPGCPPGSKPGGSRPARGGAGDGPARGGAARGGAARGGAARGSADEGPANDGPTYGGAGGEPADGGSASDAPGNPHIDDWPWIDEPVSGKGQPGDEGPAADKPGDEEPAAGEPGDEEPAADKPGDEEPAAGEPGDEEPAAGEPDDEEPATGEPDDEEPATGEPDDEEPATGEPDDDPACPSAGSGPIPWPDATPFLREGPAALKHLLPAGSGYLDLRLPWLTFSQDGPEPGYLTRLGPITPGQARYLAILAAADTTIEWRVVLTDSTGRAISVTRARPARSHPGPARASPASTCSLLRRVTVIISADELTTAALDRQRAGDSRTEDNLAGIRSAIISAAQRAADQAVEQAAADAAAGGCAHTQASPAYQVPARLREFVNLRDLTCRFPTCRQPAQRCDADHTRPYGNDGPTCSCNLGPLCRYHHQLKQHQQWHLDQPAPGIFTWTTPTGRIYTTEPDPQAA